MPYHTTSDGCRLFYQVKPLSPTHPWVIFLNGTTQTALQWLPTARTLSDDFNILIYDARAQGRSALGPAQLDLGRHAADLRELMDHLDIPAANLVGLSHGALVGLKLAVDIPARALKLVLCGMGFSTTAFNRIVIRGWLEVLQLGGIEALAWAMLPEILGRAFLADQQAVAGEMVKAVVHRNRRRSLEAHLRAVLTYPPPAEWIEPVSVPCMLVNGDEDRLADIDAAAGAIGPAPVKRVILENCGHSCPLEAPRRFTACIKKFLAST